MTLIPSCGYDMGVRGNKQFIQPIYNHQKE
jgi:hypothetical protein